MCSNDDCSNVPNQPLGLLLCLLVIAYIYYFRASQQQKSQSQDQTQDPIDITAVASAAEDSVPTNDLSLDAKLLKAFEAGTKTYMQFDIKDIRSIKREVEERNHESREREKRMKATLEEFAKSKFEVETQMKRWREEQLRMIWDGKRKGERGFAGWLRFGSPRVTSSTVRDEDVKEVRYSALEEMDGRDSTSKEVIFDDMKKE